MASRKLTSERQKNLPGKVFTTNNYGDLMIKDYINSTNVLVEFLGTGYRSTTTMSQIKKGLVRDLTITKSSQGIYFGVGYIGIGKYVICDNRDAFIYWQGMLRRCYEYKYHILYPTYKTCRVCKEWLSFQHFADWYHKQNIKKGWHLDKDIISKGNKIYSPENCVFVPSRINLLFVKRNSMRGLFPIGVSYRNGRFIASCQDGTGKLKNLGRFDTSYDAFNAYKTFKENIIKRVANEFKDQIDIRLYNAMMKYQVEITD